MSRTGEKMEISLKAYGKINLGLDVVRRREDGYHEVKMIMQTVDLWDELTFCDVTTDEIVITSDSSELPDVKDNIIYKACRMMKVLFLLEGELLVRKLESDTIYEHHIRSAAYDLATKVSVVGRLVISQIVHAVDIDNVSMAAAD